VEKIRNVEVASRGKGEADKCMWNEIKDKQELPFTHMVHTWGDLQNQSYNPNLLGQHLSSLRDKRKKGCEEDINTV